MYTIYSYFNIDQIQGILNAVVSLVGSGGVDGDYLSLIRIAGMIGIMIAVAGGMVKARGEDAGMYIVMMAIFYSTLFTPRVTVTIEDAGGGGGAAVTVDNVPLGLAFFASTTSKVGHWFTDKTETFFALPDDTLKFSRHGLMGGVRALRESSGAMVADPVLAQDMVNFMRDCINPELATSMALMTSLMQSRDIFTSFDSLGLINPGRMVSFASSPVPLDCRTGYDALTPKLTAETTNMIAEIAKKISPNATPAAATTLFSSMLPAAEGMIMTASASAGDAIRQRMMINMLNDTSKTLAQVLNDPSAAQNAAASAMAAQSANASYAVMAKLAAETLPMIRNAIELVIIGVFPIVLVLIIMAGAKGGAVLQSYVQTMIWVQLWAPLYAIVNYVGALTASKQMSASLAGIDGVTVSNAAALLNTAISAEAVTGILTISVPIIALALVKGGEAAMSGVVSGMTGPASQAANKIGGSAGLGNYSAANMQWGNISENNVASNKVNGAFAGTDANLRTITDGGGANTYKGGEQTGWTPTGFGQGIVGAKIGSGENLSNADFGGRTVAGGQQRTAGLNSVMTAMLATESGASSVRSLEKGLQHALGNDFSFGSLFSGGFSAKSSDGAGVQSSRHQGRGITGKTEVAADARITRGNAVETASEPQNRAAPGSVAPAGSAGTVGGAPAAAAAGAAALPGAAAGSSPQPLGTVPAASSPAGASKASPGGTRPTGAAGVSGGAKSGISFTSDVGEKDNSTASSTGGYDKETGSKYDKAFKVLDGWSKSHRDSHSQQAASAIRAALQDSQAASMSTTQSSSDTQSAGNEQRSTRTAGYQTSFAVGGEAALAIATALHGGNREQAQIALAKGGATAWATEQILSGSTISPSGREWVAQSGLRLPENPNDLKSSLDSKVDSANTANHDATAHKDASNQAAVRSEQYANPKSDVNTDSFDANYAQQFAATAQGLDAKSRDAAVSSGANQVAKDLYNNKNDAGVGNFLRNFDDLSIGGITFKASKATADDISRVMQTVAGNSPVIQGGLIEAANNGGHIPDGIRNYMVQEAGKLHEKVLHAKDGSN